MIDWTKPVETDEENPRPVRVLATDFKAKGFPYMCAVDYGDYENHGIFSAEGWDTQRVMRLRNVRPKKVKREGWVNVCKYSHPITGYHAENIYCTKEEAVKRHSSYTIDTIHIEWEDWE
jgi:hypothetical protein